MSTQALRTIATRALLTGLVAAVSACSGDTAAPISSSAASPSETSAAAAPTPASPEHRVEVHLNGIKGARGTDVAGVLFRAKTVTDVRSENAVGGFGVGVESDPFSYVAAVSDGSVGFFPFLSGPPADLIPGSYILMMWRAPRLGSYSKWFPADSPGITGCPVLVQLGDSPVRTVTVAGFPEQPATADLYTQLPCLQ